MSEILILAGSNGKNLELAKQFGTALNALGSRASVLDLVALNLPLYTPQSGSVPNSVSDLMATLMAAKGFVVVAPEYNGSIPPALNNFIAWVSKTGDDFRSVFNGKAAAIASFSGTGTNVLQIMRLQLSYLGANVVGRQLQANFGKPANPESISAISAELIRLIK